MGTIKNVSNVPVPKSYFEKSDISDFEVSLKA